MAGTGDSGIRSLFFTLGGAALGCVLTVGALVAGGRLDPPPASPVKPGGNGDSSAEVARLKSRIAELERDREVRGGRRAATGDSPSDGPAPAPPPPAPPPPSAPNPAPAPKPPPPAAAPLGVDEAIARIGKESDPKVMLATAAALGNTIKAMQDPVERAAAVDKIFADFWSETDPMKRAMLLVAINVANAVVPSVEVERMSRLFNTEHDPILLGATAAVLKTRLSGEDRALNALMDAVDRSTDPAVRRAGYSAFADNQEPRVTDYLLDSLERESDPQGQLDLVQMVGGITTRANVERVVPKLESILARSQDEEVKTKALFDLAFFHYVHHTSSAIPAIQRYAAKEPDPAYQGRATRLLDILRDDRVSLNDVVRLFIDFKKQIEPGNEGDQETSR